MFLLDYARRPLSFAENGTVYLKPQQEEGLAVEEREKNTKTFPFRAPNPLDEGVEIWKKKEMHD